MKFLERLVLVIYSYIILILAVILGLLIFNWIELEPIVKMLETQLTGIVSSKVILGVCIVFILLSIKCIFFDERSKEKMKESQGILLKNENGELMITKETIDNMVKTAIVGFANITECNTKIDVDNDNQIKITLYITVYDNVIIKELASNLQNKVKETVKKVSDLDVKEVNVRIMKIQTAKKDIEE